MDPARISRLSKRQHDVLRGVAELKKTKQIAAELGIAPGTVDGYIAEAVRALGAVDRGEAARWLMRHDGTPPSEAAPSPTIPPSPPPSPPPAPPLPTPPGNSGGQSSGVGGSPAAIDKRDQPVVEPEAPSATTARPPWPGDAVRAALPIRQPGQRANDLPVMARLLWVPAIALILAVGFGALANGLTVLADLIERLSHLFR